MSNELFKYDALNYYQLILDLPAAVKTRFAALKTAFDLDYKGLAVAGSQPFIYLAIFSQYESMELQTVYDLERIALGFMPFKIHLKNFGHANQNEIFVGVEDTRPIDLLVQELNGVSSYFMNEKFNRTPRVTIARKLNLFQFNKSWERYAHEHFSATFVVNNMLVLKRMEGYKSWQVLKCMEFQNLLIPD